MIQHNMFQSTRPRGARHGIKHGLMIFLVQFQSTRPRGARRPFNHLPATRVGFNPRARVGRDVNERRSYPACWCFNPRARVGRDRILRFCIA